MTTKSTTPDTTLGDRDGSACCGTQASATGAVAERPAATSPCCGTTADADSSGGCCGSHAKQEAIKSGAGCCG